VDLDSDPHPHQRDKLDPDPHQRDKPDPDPHQVTSQNAQNAWHMILIKHFFKLSFGS
jgi:hypothetical protein